jgi:electron transport complex protein RnfB
VSPGVTPQALALPALVDAIDAVLPQTQCTRCGYPDCRSYAQAIAAGDADINRCPPGGAEGVIRLAALTGRALRPLDDGCGAEGPRRVALIIESACIGCTRCIDACPVDCIVGAPKQMHTVIESLCTGCELCLPACPVDCIALEDVTPGRTGWAAWSPALAVEARERYRIGQARRERDRLERADRLEAYRTLPVAKDGPAEKVGSEGRRTAIEAARLRARALRDAS